MKEEKKKMYELIKIIVTVEFLLIRNSQNTVQKKKIKNDEEN